MNVKSTLIFTSRGLMLVLLFVIADAVVGTAATDEDLVIILQEVDDHAKLSEERHSGCLDVDRPFIPTPLTPTLLERFLYNLNLALHARVFDDGFLGAFCPNGFDGYYYNKKYQISLPTIRPLLSR